MQACDRGGGVPEAEQERIFEPFFRARGTREGDGGVGLSLVKEHHPKEHHPIAAARIPLPVSSMLSRYQVLL